jgi:hypothetical protein
MMLRASWSGKREENGLKVYVGIEIFKPFINSALVSTTRLSNSNWLFFYISLASTVSPPDARFLVF